MDVSTLPPGHYVATRHPDGRYVIVPWDDPLAPLLRRLNAARGHAGTAPDDPAAWARVAAWLDEREPPES